VKCIRSEYDNQHWTTIGWYTIEPGQNAVVLGSALVNRYIYIYANTKDDQYIWKGDHQTCVSYSKFQYFEGFSTKECPSILGFQLIDVGTRTQATIPLTCEGAEYKPSYYNPPSWPPGNNYEEPSPSKPKPPKPAAQPSQAPSATSLITLTKVRNDCPSVNCAFTHNYVLRNTSSSRDIQVTYEHLDRMGKHISTGKTALAPHDEEQIGTNYKDEYFQVLSARYAD